MSKPKNAALSELAGALVVTAEVCGTELSVAAAEAMARELLAYPVADVGAALGRVRRELTGRLTLAAVLQRLPNGHPGGNEAWPLCPRDEATTVVWTEQMAEAFGVAAPLLREGDQVAARMAFLECYAKLVREAESARQKPHWIVSLGHDPALRDSVLLVAVERGQLTAGDAERMLTTDDGRDRLARLGAGGPKALPPPPKEPEPEPDYLPPDEVAALARAVLDKRSLRS